MSSQMFAALQQVVGKDAVRRRTESAPGWLDAEAVVLPEAPEQAAAALAWCAAEGVAVRAAGACGWLHGGRRAVGRQTSADAGIAPVGASSAAVGTGAGGVATVVLSSGRMATVGPYDPADLVVGVQAGATLEAVQQTLAANGQMLPLDPPAVAGATIGAVTALNAGGPLRAGYGAPRDQVLGVELVSGDGRILRFGGQVVKNVAGYDVTRLVVGSAGMLGFITSLHIRVAARPAADRTLVLVTPGPADAAALALACRDAVNPAALEVLGPDGTKGEWQVAVRVHGSVDGVADAVHRLQSLGPVVDADGTLWARLAAAEGVAPAALRLTGRPGELAALLAAGNRFAKCILRSANGLTPSGPPPAATARCAAHAADGVVRVWLPGEPGATAVVAAEALREAGAELAATAENNCWTWRYDVMPGAVRAGHVPAGRSRHGDHDLVPADSVPEPRAAALMAQIRNAFDPAGILK